MSYWTCQRQADGIRCRKVNPARKRNCQRCGKPRPARKRPAHLDALKLSYEQYVDLNGGEHCAICHRKPSASRKLDRDHCHTAGEPRGLLCSRCNRALPNWVTSAWLRAAAAYVERTGDRP